MITTHSAIQIYRKHGNLKIINLMLKNKKSIALFDKFKNPSQTYSSLAIMILNRMDYSHLFEAMNHPKLPHVQ